jgi:hypothetical protein
MTLCSKSNIFSFSFRTLKQGKIPCIVIFTFILIITSNSERRILACISRIGYPKHENQASVTKKPRSMKSVVLSVVFIRRVRYVPDRIRCVVSMSYVFPGKSATPGEKQARIRKRFLMHYKKSVEEEPLQPPRSFIASRYLPLGPLLLIIEVVSLVQYPKPISCRPHTTRPCRIL